MKITKVDIIIILLAFINIIFILFILDKIAELDYSIKIAIIALFFIIEVIILKYSVTTFYQKPILELELAIKKFLTGKYKNEKIELKKTQNEELDYIIKFFNNTIKTLKNIKEEFLHGKEIK
jgi:methyl-accepting chemotaxis protein